MARPRVIASDGTLATSAVADPPDLGRFIKSRVVLAVAPLSRMKATVDPSPLIFASVTPTVPDEFVSCANELTFES